MKEETKQSITYNKEEALKRYHAALFTQLVIHGISVESANNRANEAVDCLTRLNLPVPEILVG